MMFLEKGFQGADLRVKLVNLLTRMRGRFWGFAGCARFGLIDPVALGSATTTTAAIGRFVREKAHDVVVVRAERQRVAAGFYEFF